MPFQASSFPIPSSSLSAAPTSLLVDPTSSSVAVLLSDSSSLLLPPNPNSSSTTVVPPNSSISTFLTLASPSSVQTLFLTASPSCHVSAWALRGAPFVPVSVSPRSLSLGGGFGIRIAGSVNYLAVYSASSAQIWVLGAKAVGDGIKLVKCAVVECVGPVYEIMVAKGVMAVGEVGGVRVFPLRPLVKGGEVRRRKVKRKDDGNGVDGGRASGKLRTLKIKQNSGEFGSFFMMIKCDKVQNSDCNNGVLSSVKAVSIHILSQKKLLVLDSGGHLYLLRPESSDTASRCVHLTSLGVTMKVQMLAVLPDVSEKRQVLWLSDGSHSVHVFSLDDTESPERENDDDEKREKSIRISVMQAVFASEKVQDIVPLSASAILLLGQRKIFAYSMS